MGTTIYSILSVILGKYTEHIVMVTEKARGGLGVSTF